MEAAKSCEFRHAGDGVAKDLSRVILRARRQTNAKDYDRDVVERVALNFSSSALSELMRQGKAFAAVAERHIIGTAGLAGQAVEGVRVARRA